MAEIAFERIAPRCGGTREAFEELCCQLARHGLPAQAAFVRLRGAGGDGGVECFATMPDGTITGWQAKYVFNVDDLLVQLSDSLATALKVHPSLDRYIVCFPFDLTGPTSRPRGRSGQVKFEAWRKSQVDLAAKGGRNLTIEDWSASRLNSELLAMDPHGGVRAYFFNSTVLSVPWFEQHIKDAITTAGPRYTPELNVGTDLSKWFGALGRTREWSSALEGLLKQCRKLVSSIARLVVRGGKQHMDAAWPEDLRQLGMDTADSLTTAIDRAAGLLGDSEPSAAIGATAALDTAITNLRSLEVQLAADLEAKHGKGMADSPGFRQFMAEYQVSLPAANLDTVRDVLQSIGELRSWIASPAGRLACEHTLVLLGAAGTGKTHSMCDAARHRLRDGQLSCIVFGHQFRGEPDPWTRLRECLGLPVVLGRDGLLDALNAAGEASGQLLIIWIDALNETRPLQYWRERLPAVAAAIARQPWLRLCVACRSSYAEHALPQPLSLCCATHKGFAGVEREACRSFFEHYGLEPPVTPILQPELANPLYLRLVCETIRSQGLRCLPSGWTGLASAIRAFLREKERRFAKDHEASPGVGLVTGSMVAIARELAKKGASVLPWSVAEQVIRSERPTAIRFNVLEWLVRSDLLIEDAPGSAATLDAEGVVRPAFERLGDFLVAQELLKGIDGRNIRAACTEGGQLAPFLTNADAVLANTGVISAVSVLLSEQVSGNCELPDALDAGGVRSAVLRVAVQSYPWRSPGGFTRASAANVREALATPGLMNEAMDAVLAVSWQPSALDAVWLHELLCSLPMAQRDSFWCGYLHLRYEQQVGPVRRLIDAAFDLPVGQVAAELAERWAIVLLWFTAAADRRVKDRATRAAVRVLTHHPTTAPAVLRRMLDVDDDAVRERVILACYAVCMLTRNIVAVSEVCREIVRRVNEAPESLDNAILRDQSRCLAELAGRLGCDEVARELQQGLTGLRAESGLLIPTDEEIKAWKGLPKLADSCLNDDFFHYSLNCLRDWTAAVPKEGMGKWILKRVADDFRYPGSGCERYDRYMLRKYGGGRGRTMWAERIGKKYQWIAMFQLAARLSDYVKRKQDRWAPKPLRKPLILVCERQLDPTMPPDIVGYGDGRTDDAWWVPSKADLALHAELPDEAWVQATDDLPDVRHLLQPISRNGQTWRVVNAHLGWHDRRDPDGEQEPYRDVWVHIEGYLVGQRQATQAFECLSGRNFFGGWMPEGATWLYGFAGEYPWGTAFNVEPEWYHGKPGDELPYRYVPVCSSLAMEWEYDATRPRSFHMQIPARVLFKPGDLWWDGGDGYRLLGGRTVLRDPSIREVGPSALLADVDDLLVRLERIKRRLIVAVLGEKRVLGGDYNKPTPQRTFSQVAMLGTDGMWESSQLVSFDDYDQAMGPKRARSGAGMKRRKTT